MYVYFVSYSHKSGFGNCRMETETLVTAENVQIKILTWAGAIEFVDGFADVVILNFVLVP